MESSRFALTVLMLLAPPTTLLGLRELAPLDSGQEHHRLEAARLTAHFDSVDAELRLATTHRLTSAQRASRATLIGWLREYREAGSFPRNDRFLDRAMPFFRDSRGVLCAMAYLIDRSGRRDLVDRIAATRNNAFIPELAGDPDLRAWLDSTGLSSTEAARVQPAYGPPWGEPDEPGISTSYAVTSILVAGSSLATVGLNALAPSRAAAWAGILAGAASFIAGAAKLDDDGTTEDVAKVNAIAGVGALTFGLYRLVTPDPGGPTDGPASGSLEQTAKVSITPLVMPFARAPRVGVSVQATF
jgi:hypothetical protein